MEVLAEPFATSPTIERPAWKGLEAHYQKGRKLHLRKLFADDPTRGERMTTPIGRASKDGGLRPTEWKISYPAMAARMPSIMY